MGISGVDAVKNQLKSWLNGKSEDSKAAAKLFTQITGEKATAKNMANALKDGEFINDIALKDLTEAQQEKVNSLAEEYKGKQGVQSAVSFLNTVTIKYDNGCTTTIFVNDKGNISKKVTVEGKGKKQSTKIEAYDDLGRLKKKTIKNHKGEQIDEVKYKYYGKTKNLKERSEVKGSGKDKIIKKTEYSEPKKDKDGKLVRDVVMSTTKNGKTTKKYITDVVDENGKTLERSTYSDKEKKKLIHKTTNNRAENGKLESKETIKYKDGKEDKKVVRENYRIENGRRCYDKVTYKAKTDKNGKVSWEKVNSKTIYVVDQILDDIAQVKKQREKQEAQAAAAAAAAAAAQNTAGNGDGGAAPPAGGGTTSSTAGASGTTSSDPSGRAAATANLRAQIDSQKQTVAHLQQALNNAIAEYNAAIKNGTNNATAAAATAKKLQAQDAYNEAVARLRELESNLQRALNGQ